MDGPRFGFLERAVQQFNDAASNDKSSYVSCLSRLESRGCNVHVLPQKITLESDICPFNDDQGNVKQQAATLSTSDINSSLAKLPSFSESLSFSGEAGRRRISPQKRFVESSARVNQIHALKNVIDPNRAACLFLSQIPVRDRTLDDNNDEEESNSRESQAFVSTIRSCIPSSNSPHDMSLLESHGSTYPVASWFTVNRSVSSTRKEEPSEVDLEIMSRKRRTFCLNANVRSSEATSRTMLLTGCSSRRNSQSRFSYRGFLTNQRVDPTVFQQRYISMLEVDKNCRKDSERKLYQSSASNTSSDGNFLCVEFTRMALRVLVDASTRQKATKPVKKRAAAYSLQLKTQRHGQLAVSCGRAKGDKENTQTQIKDNEPLIRASMIDNFAASFGNGKPSAESDITNDGRMLEGLGKDTLSVRGELLHLCTKASELEEEERAYLEELKVVNGRPVSTPKHVPFDCKEDVGVPVEVGHEPSHNTGTGLSETDTSSNGKRKASPTKVTHSDVGRNNEKKRSKKKRKKDESKKASKKSKRRKRKLRDEEVSESTSKPGPTKKSKSDTAIKAIDAKNPATSTSDRPAVQMAVPSFAVRISPINPSDKKSELPRQAPNTVAKDSTKPTARTNAARKEDLVKRIAAGQKINTSILNSESRNRSPDSVASLAEGRKVLFPGQDESEDEDEDRLHTPRALEEDGGGVVEVEHNEKTAGMELTAEYDENLLEDSGYIDDSLEDASETNQSLITKKSNEGQERSKAQNEDKSFGDNESRYVVPKGPLTLLTSESFLEQFGETIADVATGRWVKYLAPNELAEVSSMVDTSITVCDSPLVDVAGVDIELEDNSGVVVQRLSSWMEDHRGIQKGARSFMRKLVSLAASGRYRSIHVILCLDVDVTSTISSELASLQNALVQQSGCHCEDVTFEYVAQRALSSSIALQLANTSGCKDNFDDISEVATDETVVERARFLLLLVPTLTVHMALASLRDDRNHGFTDSAVAMQRLFCLAKSTQCEQFIQRTNGVMSDVAAKQFWLANNVDLSHAY